jgi:hypothetical protein
MFNEGNQIHNFMSSSDSGTLINYGSGSGSDFLTSYGSGYGSGSTSQKVTVPTVPVPVPQHWYLPYHSKVRIRISSSSMPRSGSACQGQRVQDYFIIMPRSESGLTFLPGQGQVRTSFFPMPKPEACLPSL